jgi:hypothetical protein
VLQGNDALVANLLLPGELVALLNPVLGVTLAAATSAPDPHRGQGGMQGGAAGGQEQTVQGERHGYQAWLRLGSERVVVVSPSPSGSQAAQQGVADTATEACHDADVKPAQATSMRDQVPGKSGMGQPGLVWGTVVSLSQCKSRWQAGGRVPVVTGELRLIGHLSPSCGPTATLQLELEQSSKVGKYPCSTHLSCNSSVRTCSDLLPGSANIPLHLGESGLPECRSLLRPPCVRHLCDGRWLLNSGQATPCYC